MISWIKNISTYCYTITRLQGYKDRTVFDRSLFRSLLYSPRFVIAGTLSLDDEERANEERKKRYRIVWYRARNEFSNKRATALCPVQHDNGNLSPSIIASSLPISGTPISTAIGMFSIFSPAISSSNSHMNLLLISLLLGEPLFPDCAPSNHRGLFWENIL